MFVVVDFRLRSMQSAINMSSSTWYKDRPAIYLVFLLVLFESESVIPTPQQTSAKYNDKKKLRCLLCRVAEQHVSCYCFVLFCFICHPFAHYFISFCCRQGVSKRIVCMCIYLYGEYLFVCVNCKLKSSETIFSL